jgi:hypothetical protein
MPIAGKVTAATDTFLTSMVPRYTAVCIGRSRNQEDYILKEGEIIFLAL